MTINPHYLISALIIITVLFISFLVGASISLSLYKFVIVIMALVVGLLFLQIPNNLIVILLFILAFFVVGQALYFGGIKQAPWVFYGISLILYVKVALILLSRKTTDTSGSILVPIVFIFILYVIVSAIINQVSLLQFILGSRDLLFTWSIFLIIALGAISYSWLDKIWSKFYLLVLFQVPIILYQALIIVPKRIASGGTHSNLSPWDAIVGGFGGDPFGGGASSTLVVFMVLAFSYYTVLYKNKQISTMLYLVVSIAAFFSIALAEVKVVIVLLPIALLIIFRDKVLKDPAKFFLSLAALVAFIFILLTGYKYQKTGEFSGLVSVDYIYEEAFERQLDFTHERVETGEIGRFAVFKHWWQENGLDDPVHTLFGYGAGATWLSSFAQGDVAKKYYYYPNLARSSAALFLWELGVIGLLLIVFVLVSASSLTLSLIKNEKTNKLQKAQLEVILVSFVLFIVTLPYSYDMLHNPALNLYMMFSLGYVVYLLNDIKKRNYKRSLVFFS